MPWPEITAYTTTEAGIEMLARQAARELVRYGILVDGGASLFACD